MGECKERRLVNQIVLLGASNLSRLLPLVMATAQRICGQPSRFLIAAGHGRSYGVYSRVWFRGLPSITHCGLWDELAQRPQLPTFALLTDLGNDIVYEQPIEKFIAWVQWCLEQLAKCKARVVVTNLPLQKLERLSPWQYYLFRMLLFPGRSLSWEQALERAYRVSELLRKLCEEQGATLVEQQPAWFGLDPIHLLRRHSAAAYEEILNPWQELNLDDPRAAHLGFYDRWRVRHFAPQYRRLFGLDRYQAQPAGLLSDGSTVLLY